MAEEPEQKDSDKKVLQAQAEELFKHPCEFILSAPALEHMPPSDLPEVAFAGRSNVGKSSLLNALASHKRLARISSTPGRTQALNFFKLKGTLKGQACYLVDLPGYGYAKAPKTAIKDWVELTRNYFRGRPNLRKVFLLIDARRGLGVKDEEVIKLFEEAAVSFQIILTKGDKLKKGEIPAILEKTRSRAKAYTTCYPEIILTSARKKEGLEELRCRIAEMALS